MGGQEGMFRRKRVYFSQVSNHLIRDTDVSLKAKGLYALIQSYLTMEGFVLYKSYLKSQCKEGEKAFENAWNELKQSGYLVQYKCKTEQGTFRYEYELLDESYLKIKNGLAELVAATPPFCRVWTPQGWLTQGVDKPDVDNAGAGKGGCLSNTVEKNIISSNNDSNNNLCNKRHTKEKRKQNSFHNFHERNYNNDYMDELQQRITGQI